MIRVVNNRYIYIVESNIGYPFQKDYYNEDMIFFDISSYNDSYNKVLISYGMEVLDIEDVKSKLDNIKETYYRSENIKTEYILFLEKALLKMLSYERDEKIKQLLKDKNYEQLLCLAC